MTKAEQQRLQHVQDSLMRSIFGGMKRGQMLAVLSVKGGGGVVFCGAVGGRVDIGVLREGG